MSSCGRQSAFIRCGSSVATSVACHLFQQVATLEKYTDRPRVTAAIPRLTARDAFCHPGWAEKEHVLGVGDKAQARQIA